MLLDRYESDPEFWAIIEHLAIETEPELAQIDSILEDDGLRVLSRCLKRAQTMVQKPIQMAKETFRDRTRSARKQARRIATYARQRSKGAKAGMKKAYQRLVKITRASVQQAHARRQGISRVILPQPGPKTEERQRYEAQGWFRRGRSFHAGIEGRVGVGKRKHGLDRCLDHREDGFDTWVVWGISAGNLAVIGRSLAAKAVQ